MKKSNKEEKSAQIKRSERKKKKSFVFVSEEEGSSPRAAVGTAGIHRPGLGHLRICPKHVDYSFNQIKTG